jgi:hypothetical protein
MALAYFAMRTAVQRRCKGQRLPREGAAEAAGKKRKRFGLRLYLQTLNEVRPGRAEVLVISGSGAA